MVTNGINKAGNTYLILDRKSPVPLYEQIGGQLRERIKSRELEPGSPLPTNRQIRDDLDVNLKTVQQALSMLAREGFIERRRGKGTFVRGIPQTAMVGIYCNFDLFASGSAYQFYRFMVAHINHQLETEGRKHRLYVGTPSPNPANAAYEDLVEDVERGRLTALLLLNYESCLDPILESSQKRGMPVVSFSPRAGAPYSARVDCYGYINSAAEHFRSLGRKRAAVIVKSPPGQIAGTELVLQILDSHGFSTDPELVVARPASMEGGYDAATSLAIDEIDGLIVTDDVMALGVDRQLTERGIDPQRLSLATHWQAGSQFHLNLPFLRFEIDTAVLVRSGIALMNDAINGRRIAEPHLKFVPKLLS